MGQPSVYRQSPAIVQMGRRSLALALRRQVAMGRHGPGGG